MWKRMITSAAILVALSACRGGTNQAPTIETTDVATEEKPAPTQVKGSLLDHDLVGLWRGRGGTVEFRPDGTVSVDIKACGMDPETLAWYSKCTSLHPSGPYEIFGNTLRVNVGTGGMRARVYLVAFIDHAGRLHLSTIGAFASLGESKSGRVKLLVGLKNAEPTPMVSDVVEIDGSRCRWLDPRDGREVISECLWRPLENENVDVLVFEAKDWIAQTPDRDRKVVLIHSPADGLAMSPDLAYVRLERVK